MTIGLPDAEGHLVAAGAARVVDEARRRGGAVVVGPGASRADGAAELIREVVARADVPVVLDADGLNAHAGRLDGLAARGGPTVLTPHAGELARLLGTDGADVGRARLRRVREAAGRADAVVVLKGDDTLIAEPGGRVAVSPGGAPALATAGTGDVLSGVIAAMLAKGLDPFAAACAGVRLHLDAGRAAALERRADSVIARDVVEALGR
jgi:NAD(P)H-hydrate epimerase